MDTLNVYTSTGIKLLHHVEAIDRWKMFHIATPISLQVAPTSRCNLRCVFCSNVNRTVHEDLDFEILFSVIKRLKMHGLKTVEWTGGGDPTLYKDINRAIEEAHKLGLQQGFITNGLLLKSKITQENIDRLHWVRVSMNCLDYENSVDLPQYRGTLGFSYVMNDKTESEVLGRLHQHVKLYRPKYVRIVPNCQVSAEMQEEQNRFYSEQVPKWGSPYFYQAKNFSAPERCWWCYFKPFVLHDGWVYPCSSVVLNDEANRSFHSSYRWVKLEDLPKMYEMNNVPPYDPKRCSHCVFRPQNDMVDNLATPDGMENFI